MKIKKIILIGFMCSGKTLIGENLAKKIGSPHIDLDDSIVKYCGKTIAEIFAEQGEDEFRKIETEFAFLLQNAENCVISAGGGIVVNEKNMEYLSQNSFVVYLKASKETILKNYKKDGIRRPLLETENLEEKIDELLEIRKPLYEKYASQIVEVENKTVEDKVKEILTGIKS